MNTLTTEQINLEKAEIHSKLKTLKSVSVSCWLTAAGGLAALCLMPPHPYTGYEIPVLFAAIFGYTMGSGATLRYVSIKETLDNYQPYTHLDNIKNLIVNIEPYLDLKEAFCQAHAMRGCINHNEYDELIDELVRKQAQEKIQQTTTEIGAILNRWCKESA